MGIFKFYLIPLQKESPFVGNVDYIGRNYSYNKGHNSDDLIIFLDNLKY